MIRANTSNLKQGSKEIVKDHGSPIVVSRFVKFTGGGFDGVSPDRKTNDLQIPMVAKVKVVSQADVLSSNGFYELGDIVTNTVPEIIGFNSDPSNKAEGDFLFYDGFKYSLKGKPTRVRIGGGRVETEATWRRT